jgi:salicylate hydroxylase
MSSAIVVGAGIGGLAAALGLLRAGQQVRVFEQVAALGEVGAGLSITPNAGKALRYLGLQAELERIGSRPPAGCIRHFKTGAVLVQLPQDQSRERYGMPLYHVHRADLHASLLAAVQALDPHCITTTAAVRRVHSTASSASVELQDGRHHEADWLVGADGIHSVTRSSLFGPDRPNFTGYVAWRGLIPGDLVPHELFEPPLCMTVGPRRLLMRYPLRGGALVNFVAIARRSTWMEEGWSVRSDLDELLTEFADFESHSLELLRLTPADRLFKWGLFDRDPLPTWTLARATLLGDAAHAMPPFTGQGAVMALEDAAVLGRVMSALKDKQSGTDSHAINSDDKGHNELDGALRRYELARHARVTAALAMSRARSELYFADDPQQQVQALGAGMAELRTLYDYDAGRDEAADEAAAHSRR